MKLLGGQRTDDDTRLRVGPSRRDLAEKVALARGFAARGFDAFKYAAAVSFDGIEDEMRALREALGTDAKLMVDLHWKFTAAEAIALIDRLAAYRPYFVEAPCAPEDLEGQAHVAAAARVPIALGEELRTVYEYRPRFERRALAIAQPEMGHTGISQFMQIARMANAFHVHGDSARERGRGNLPGRKPARVGGATERADARVPALGFRSLSHVRQDDDALRTRRVLAA